MSARCCGTYGTAYIVTGMIPSGEGLVAIRSPLRSYGQLPAFPTWKALRKRILPRKTSFFGYNSTYRGL